MAPSLLQASGLRCEGAGRETVNDSTCGGSTPAGTWVMPLEGMGKVLLLCMTIRFLGSHEVARSGVVGSLNRRLGGKPAMHVHVHGLHVPVET